MYQSLIERRGDLAAVRGQAGIETIDVGLQVFRDILGALPHAVDDFAAEGFDGAIELRDVTGDQRAQRAAVAAEFLRKFRALVPHQFIEGAHLQAERVVGVFSLADYFGDQRIDGNVQCVARLVAAGKNARRQPITGFVDPVHQVAAAQFEFEQQASRWNSSASRGPARYDPKFRRRWWTNVVRIRW